jgi:hypothetical protein
MTLQSHYKYYLQACGLLLGVLVFFSLVWFASQSPSEPVTHANSTDLGNEGQSRSSGMVYQPAAAPQTTGNPEPDQQSTSRPENMALSSPEEAFIPSEVNSVTKKADAVADLDDIDERRAHFPVASLPAAENSKPADRRVVETGKERNSRGADSDTATAATPAKNADAERSLTPPPSVAAADSRLLHPPSELIDGSVTPELAVSWTSRDIDRMTRRRYGTVLVRKDRQWFRLLLPRQGPVNLASSATPLTEAYRDRLSNRGILLNDRSKNTGGSKDFQLLAHRLRDSLRSRLIQLYWFPSIDLDRRFLISQLEFLRKKGVVEADHGKVRTAGRLFFEGQQMRYRVESFQYKTGHATSNGKDQNRSVSISMKMKE